MQVIRQSENVSVFFLESDYGRSVKQVEQVTPTLVLKNCDMTI